MYDSFGDLIPIMAKDGYVICFNASDEDYDMEQHFVNDCGWSKREFKTIEGYEWFVARVSAWKDGVELGYSVLGCCCYAELVDFYDKANEQFIELVDEAIEDARNKELHDYRKLATQDPLTSLIQ